MKRAIFITFCLLFSFLECEKKREEDVLKFEQREKNILEEKLKNIDITIKKAREYLGRVRIVRSKIVALGGFKAIPKSPAIEDLKKEIDSAIKRCGFYLKDQKFDIIEKEGDIVKVTVNDDYSFDININKEELLGKVNITLLIVPKNSRAVLDCIDNNIKKAERIIQLKKLEKKNGDYLMKAEAYFFRKVKLPKIKIKRCKPYKEIICRKINKKLKSYKRSLYAIVRFKLEKEKIDLIDQLKADSNT